MDKELQTRTGKSAKATRIVLMIGSCGIVTICIPLILLYCFTSIAPQSILPEVKMVSLAGLSLLPILYSFIIAMTMNSIVDKNSSWPRRLMLMLAAIILLGVVLVGPLMGLGLLLDFENVDETSQPMVELPPPGLSIAIIIACLIIGGICGTYFEKYLENKTREEKRLWSGIGIAVITMLVLVSILMWISFPIRIAWIKPLFNLSSHSLTLLYILTRHLFVFSVSCLASSFILGFKVQRRGGLHGAIFGGTLSLFMPTVPLIVGVTAFAKAFQTFSVGRWYVWVIISVCFLSMVICGALGGFVGERLARKRHIHQ